MAPPISNEELGVRALPPDATAAQRAHAEAVWRGTDDPRARCRCSGTGCRHGQPCDLTDGCPGRLRHADRYPGSVLGLTEWWDEYACGTCQESFGCGVTLPEVPWGELRAEGERTTTTVYPGVRHPNFPDLDPDGNPIAEPCFECSAFHCADCPAMREDADLAGMDADEDGWYTLTCCCGAHAESHQTLEAEYAQMNEQLKGLQWPDAPRPEGRPPA